MAEASTRQVGEKTYTLQLIRELTDPAGAFAIRFYHGVEPDLDRPVAIEEMVALGQNDRGFDFLDRAGNEAHHLAELGDHPNLAAVYEVVETPNRIWLVFEMPEDATLAETLMRPASPLPTERGIATVIDIALSICQGLATLHRSGLAHRDLSPRSVTIGQPSVLFDLVLAALPSHETYRRGIPSALGYRAPEQNPSQDALSLSGPATDIYALGGLLYHLVTSEPPPIRFSRDPLPMPIARNPAVPAALNAILSDCLAYDADQRPDIAHIRKVLQQVRHTLDVSIAEEEAKPEGDSRTQLLAEHFNQGLPEPPTLPPTPSPWQPKTSLPERSTRIRATQILIAVGGVMLILAVFAILFISRLL
jgi:serine/threonine protein kinase